MTPEVRYAWSSDVSIAYQVVSDGPFDLVWTPGALSVADLARAIRCACAVRDAVAGRGRAELEGVPGEWKLYAVAGT